jgi:hypothetical protein
VRIYIAELGGYSYLLPAAAAVYRWGRLSTPLRLLAIYAALTLAESMWMWHLAHQNVNNLWMIHFFTPIEATLFLWMFASWQLREVARLTLLLCIPLYLIVWGMLHLTVESVTAFPHFTKPVECLLLVGAAAYTLVTRSQHLLVPIVRYSWFWVSVGTLLYFSFLTLLNPISNLLLESHRGLVIAAFEMNATMGILANLFFAWALLCKNPHPSSGGSSLPRPSSASFLRRPS